MISFRSVGVFMTSSRMSCFPRLSIGSCLVLIWLFPSYATWLARRCISGSLVWVCLCTSIGCQKFQFSFVRETKAHSFDEVFCLVTSWSCFCYVLNRDMITSSRTGENQPFCALLWDNNISKQHT
jgi:hypothetical protein